MQQSQHQFWMCARHSAAKKVCARGCRSYSHLNTSISAWILSPSLVISFMFCTCSSVRDGRSDRFSSTTLVLPSEAFHPLVNLPLTPLAPYCAKIPRWISTGLTPAHKIQTTALFFLHAFHTTHLIRLVQNLYGKATGKIRVEDDRTQQLPFKRGVRQECPLSPVLFIACGEMIMKNMKVRRTSRYHPWRTDNLEFAVC